MPTVFNPFLVFVLVAVVVLIAIAVVSQRRARSVVNATGSTTQPGVPTALAVLGLAAVLVPVGIAIAALGGPTAGVVAYVTLLVGGLLWWAARRSRA